MKAKRTKLNATLAVVEWGDVWGSNGWQDSEKLKEEHGSLPVVSVGFLIRHDKKGAMITQGFSKDGIPLMAQFIPKGMIQKITKVKY